MGWKYVELDSDECKAISVHQAAAILIARLHDDVDADAMLERAVETQTAITVPGDLDGEALLVPPDLLPTQAMAEQAVRDMAKQE